VTRKLVLETPIRESSRFRRSVAYAPHRISYWSESETMSHCLILGWVPGTFELLLIAGVALLLFGHRLPSVMRSLGRGVVEFKEGLKGEDDEDEEASTPKVDDEKTGQKA
jgi:sec-independent protein translocase protein TatA